MEVKFKDEKELEELHKDVSKKQKFEDTVAPLNSLLRLSASPRLRRLYYGVFCRVAIVLKTRYTSPGFWAAGLALFQLAHSLVSDPSEKAHLLACIDEARQVVHQENDPLPGSRRLLRIKSSERTQIAAFVRKTWLSRTKCRSCSASTLFILLA